MYFCNIGHDKESWLCTSKINKSLLKNTPYFLFKDTVAFYNPTEARPSLSPASAPNNHSN